MYNLSTAAGVRAVMSRFGLAAKKKLGQHFLIDPHVLEKIITAANIREGDAVLEIGPGLGGMTQALLNAGAKVTAVELDKQLVPILKELFAGEKLTLVQGDILRLELFQLVEEIDQLNCNRQLKVVANLPYYITTPVIFRLLESGLPFESITVMIQKEVARRLSASPGTKDYGSLTLAVQYYADVRLIANVPVNSFMPRPAVDSAVVQFSLLPVPRVDTDKEMLFAVIKAAFGKRRKTLLNALGSENLQGTESTSPIFSKAALTEAMEKCGISPQARGETLNIFEFAKLAEALRGTPS